MTLMITPETEAKLREKAAREGRDVHALADTLLARLLADEDRAADAESAAIQAGLDAVAAGREKPLEHYLAEQRTKRGLPESWPNPSAVRETSPGTMETS